MLEYRKYLSQLKDSEIMIESCIDTIRLEQIVGEDGKEELIKKGVIKVIRDKVSLTDFGKKIIENSSY